MAPVAEVADPAMARLHSKALKRGREFRKLQPEKRHELRLTLKNLCYATEFSLPLYTDSSLQSAGIGCLSPIKISLKSARMPRSMLSIWHMMNDNAEWC
jgi:triphosphatase